MRLSFLPTRRLAVVAVLVAVALIFYPGDPATSLLVSLAAVNSLLAVLAVIDAVWAGGGSVTITRKTPPVIAMGSTAPWTLTIGNEASRTLRAVVAESLPASFGLRPSNATVKLAPHSSATVSFEVCPQRRGRFEVGEVTLRTTGPLGLVYRQYRREVPGLLRVHPLFRSRDEAELRVRRARYLDIGQRSVKGLGSGTEFEQLREYTPDDEFRRVDWAASARVGKTIVRTYRPERNQNVVVMLDNGRLMAGRAGDVPRLEYGIDAVLMLTTVGTALGDKVGLVTFDQTVHSTLAPRRNKNQLGRVAEAMYQLEPVLAESDYRAAFSHTAARFRKRSLLVLLTELSPQAFGESVMSAFPLLMRHHLVMVGSVRDPAVDRWASSLATTPEEVYRRAAAVAALNERDLLITRLRGAGIEVVDSVPGRLAPELADAYIDLKSAGRL